MSRIFFSTVSFLWSLPASVWALFALSVSLVYWANQSEVPIEAYRMSFDLSLVSAGTVINLSRWFDSLFLFLVIIVWMKIIKAVATEIENGTSDDEVGVFICWWFALLGSAFALVSGIYAIVLGEALVSLLPSIIGILMAVAYALYQEEILTGGSLMRFLIVMAFSKRDEDDQRFAGVSIPVPDNSAVTGMRVTSLRVVSITHDPYPDAVGDGQGLLLDVTHESDEPIDLEALGSSLYGLRAPADWVPTGTDGKPIDSYAWESPDPTRVVAPEDGHAGPSAKG
ncbi:MAG: hypothetical protein V4519_04785 [Patescibacteria group bacterium]